MAKNKKTRKEKKLSDQRRQISVASTQRLAPVMEKVAMPVSSAKAEQNKAPVINVPPVAISTSGYNYLFSDLAKTAILTSSIIIAEIVIKQLTLNH